RCPYTTLFRSLDALKVRPMRKGAALPVTFVAGLATRTLYSAISGNIIDPESVLAAYENSMIAPIYNRTELGELIGTSTRTDKVVANTVVLAPEERGRRLAHRDLRAAILRLAESGGADKLESQCINGECLAALQEDDVARFLEARAAAIHALACNLAGATPSS